MKRCHRCETDKPDSAFQRSKAKADGLQSQCRECRKVGNAMYYQMTKDKQRSARKAIRASLLERNRQVVRDALGGGCVDCGTTDIRVLEFDHLHDKLAAVAKLMAQQASVERLKAEIKKCEVVCANCHRIRTYTRCDSWRLGVPLSR